MTPTVAIYYFSGTGNTEICANSIKSEFERNGCRTDLFKIEDVLKKQTVPSIEKYDLIGIGSPVSAFSCPRIVFDFIKTLPQTTGKKTFIFKTAGGVAEINYNSSSSIIKKLSEKGYGIIYDRLFSIGSNWIVKFDETVTVELYKATLHKIELMCVDILENRQRSLKAGIKIRIITGAIHFFKNLGIRFIAKDYKVTKDCTLCGTCAADCPTGNIRINKNGIRFGLSCLWCMRCVYRCPQNAIRHRALSFSAVTGGYNPVKIIKSHDIDNNTMTGFIPPFAKRYITDDSM